MPLDKNGVCQTIQRLIERESLEFSLNSNVFAILELKILKLELQIHVFKGESMRMTLKFI